MKRILPLLATLVLLVGLLVVPASAAENNVTYDIQEPNTYFSFSANDGIIKRLLIFQVDNRWSPHIEIYIEGLTVVAYLDYNQLPSDDVERPIVYIMGPPNGAILEIPGTNDDYDSWVWRLEFGLEGFDTLAFDAYSFNSADNVIFELPTVSAPLPTYFVGDKDYSALLIEQNTVLYQIRNILRNFGDYWNDLLSYIKNEMNLVLTSIWAGIGEVNNAVRDGFANVGTWFSDLKAAMISGFSSVETWIKTFHDRAVTAWGDITNKLDQLIEGTGAAADKIEQGASDLSQAGSDLAGDVGKIEDFEDQQFAVLDQNFSEITSGGDISNLSSSLLFILAYTNHVVEAVPSNYRAYWTVPFFFGILFLICQHTAGVTSTAQAIDYSQNKPKQVTGFGASLNNSKKR